MAKGRCHRRVLLPCIVTMAMGCASPGPDAEPGSDDSDATSNGGGGSDGETDEAPDVSAPSCPPTPLSEAPGRAELPNRGEAISYARRIEACAGPEGLEGRWKVDVRDLDGHRICGFDIPFASDVPVACEGCGVAFEDATWGEPSISNAAWCALFGLDQDFVEGVRDGYRRLAVRADPADILLRFEGEFAPWQSIDPNPTAVREGASLDGVVGVTLAFEERYAY